MRHLTAIIRPEGTGFVAFCPELDIASEGDTLGEARANLQEALELFFECSSAFEIEYRLSDSSNLENDEFEDAEFEDDWEAIKEALDAIEAGDVGTPAEEVFRRVREQVEQELRRDQSGL